MPRGGKREGSGRKKLDNEVFRRVSFSCTLPRWLIKIAKDVAVQNNMSISRFIECLLYKHSIIAKALNEKKQSNEL